MTKPSEDTGDIIDCMAQMKGDNQPFALATVVRTEDATSTKAGDKAVIRADGSMVGWLGGSCTIGATKKNRPARAERRAGPADPRPAQGRATRRSRSRRGRDA